MIDKIKIEVAKKILNTLKECLQEAPLDFLGTGSNSKAAAQEELEWRDKWQNSYIYLKDFLDGLDQPTK